MCNLKIYNKYVITDDEFLQPSYGISPFTTKDISKNMGIVSSESSNECLQRYFKGQNYTFTLSGRDALNKALKQYNLKKDDVVTVLTTTGNFYISGCVTREIEKFCKWSREIEDKTKVLLVNHEFGFPYEELSCLLELGFPIIEDCAHSFISQNKENLVGKVGEYVIYSLPKFFPVQFGGVLIANNKENISSDLSLCEKEYLEKTISHYIPSIDQIKTKRRQNYLYLEKELEKINLKSRFEMDKIHCPGVYMFIIKGYDLPKLKVFMQEHGVESSVFYGEDSFFIPVNQALEKEDLDYFICLIKRFLSGIEVEYDK